MLYLLEKIEKMDTREIAAQLFLDAVNGRNVTADQAKQSAIWAWETARVFDAHAPKALAMNETQRSFNMGHKMSGCRACFGSGGKKNSPCKVCHGTGKIDRRSYENR